MAGELPRVLMDLRHGEHIATDATVQVQRNAAMPVSTPISRAARNGEGTDAATPFGYLFPTLASAFPHAHLNTEPTELVVRALKALGSAMVEQRSNSADSGLPPILTYWGQFVDHDLTANTDRDTAISSITTTPLGPLQPQYVVQNLVNLREPRLNLDSVYGNGPKESGPDDQVPYDADGRLVIGTKLFPTGSGIGGADLPRKGGKAQIGDGRNDENLIVAQLHLAFLKFHNNTVDWLAGHGGGDFDRARELTTWHYQQVTVEDYLKLIADPAVVTGLLDGSIPRLFQPDEQNPFMPLEFSVAAFRFGHSMIRGGYDWNQNFPNASLDLLFGFTGSGGLLQASPEDPGNPTLPDNWPAQFERLTGFEPGPGRVARKIDTQVAPPLAALIKEGNEAGTAEQVRRLLKRLAVRNLLRGYRLAIPTGQAVATELGITPLTTDQLLNGVAAVTPDPNDTGDSPVKDVLLDNPELQQQTPLWFYILREAEIDDKGRLGPVGSRIVAETIIGQLMSDPASYLRRGFDPSQGVTKRNGGRIETIVDFLQFADMHTT